MKLGDALREAANEWLDDATPYAFPYQKWYSCDAVRCALRRGGIRRALQFIQELGCDPRSSLMFYDLRVEPRELQGARFLWLHFAALVADDMGIEV